jgi:hypothetical protein
MSGSNFLKALFYTAATVAVIMLLPDVKRYIRISTM